MNNMSKNALQEMIEFHEQQIADNQRRIDELREQFNHEALTEKEKPAPMFGQALRLEDDKFVLFSNSKIKELIKAGYMDNDNFINQGNAFISKEAAELEAEKRRLRQLARVRITESWRDERPREFDDNVKIVMGYEKPQITDEFSPLCFRCMSDAESFLKEVGQDGISKILSL